MSEQLFISHYCGEMNTYQRKSLLGGLLAISEDASMTRIVHSSKQVSMALEEKLRAHSPLINKGKERDRETERQRDRDRQTDTHTEERI